MTFQTPSLHLHRLYKKIRGCSQFVNSPFCYFNFTTSTSISVIAFKLCISFGSNISTSSAFHATFSPSTLKTTSPLRTIAIAVLFTLCAGISSPARSCTFNKSNYSCSNTSPFFSLVPL